MSSFPSIIVSVFPHLKALCSFYRSRSSLRDIQQWQLAFVQCIYFYDHQPIPTRRDSTRQKLKDNNKLTSIFVWLLTHDHCCTFFLAHQPTLTELSGSLMKKSIGWVGASHHYRQQNNNIRQMVVIITPNSNCRILCLIWWLCSAQ